MTYVELLYQDVQGCKQYNIRHNKNLTKLYEVSLKVPFVTRMRSVLAVPHSLLNVIGGLS